MLFYSSAFNIALILYLLYYYNRCLLCLDLFSNLLLLISKTQQEVTNYDMNLKSVQKFDYIGHN